MAIEKCYGQMKRRFPLLKNGLRFKDPYDSQNCIIAIVVIYNFCKRHKDNDDNFFDEDDYLHLDQIGGVDRFDHLNEASTKRDTIARNF